MARIRSGILSKTTGKVGGVVGGTWKGINYLREYVVPANPRTMHQTTWREQFGRAVLFAKAILGAVLIPFMDKFIRRKSAYNWFIGKNVKQFGTTPNYEAIRITEGKLPSVRISAASGTSQSQVNVALIEADLNALENNDLVYAIIVDPQTGKVCMNSTDVASAKMTPSILVEDNGIFSGKTVVAYVFTARVIDEKLESVGNSDAKSFTRT